MDNEKRLLHVVGLADVCELLAAAFAFPDEALACALAEGSFAEDARACLSDAGADAAALTRADQALASFAGESGETLLPSLKRAYSLLYLAPGREVPVFPYEAAFRFVAEGRSGSPSLFRSPVTLDVEQQMREAGVLPKAARTEPSDSAFLEFEFLSFLYGSLAAALEQVDVASEALWRGRIERFQTDHALVWLPAFMERTCAMASDFEQGERYASLACFAREALLLLAAFDGKGERS